MPPPGGYRPIDWAKKVPKKGFGGYALFAFYGAFTAFGAVTYYFAAGRKQRLVMETMEARVALEPFLLAEKERLYLTQLRKNRDHENELMKGVKGWQTGKLGDVPVYHNKQNDWINPSVEEYYAHSSYWDMYNRIFEKADH